MTDNPIMEDEEEHIKPASGEHLSKKRFEEDGDELNIVEQYLKLNEK